MTAARRSALETYRARLDNRTPWTADGNRQRSGQPLCVQLVCAHVSRTFSQTWLTRKVQRVRHPRFSQRPAPTQGDPGSNSPRLKLLSIGSSPMFSVPALHRRRAGMVDAALKEIGAQERRIVVNDTVANRIGAAAAVKTAAALRRARDGCAIAEHGTVVHPLLQSHRKHRHPDARCCPRSNMRKAFALKHAASRPEDGVPAPLSRTRHRFSMP